MFLLCQKKFSHALVVAWLGFVFVVVLFVFGLGIRLLLWSCIFGGLA